MVYQQVALMFAVCFRVESNFIGFKPRFFELKPLTLVQIHLDLLE